MPQVSEIASSMVPVGGSSDSSQQISSTSTSPEQVDSQQTSKALSVRKSKVKPSSRSSSSSSRALLPPSGINRVSSGGIMSHRGQGSVPNQGAPASQTALQMDVDVDVYYDQRAVHHEQHFHDQRSRQQLNVVQVGLDPETAH